ncbi:DegT/DnrJ/EryC1/StrS family aminotransferase [Cyanobium sp. ATX 6E8]|uniref:DegT/DnrJ/EryC1/StrS family aminotransferase n=1 Tax=Cyanobium sp. ATX 6E8 TaxID=2823701 RepID=UPI0020CB6DB2|nr:DegT/DnrJ/EryC1/StrS family aminotransferase [Cyanobium sp. ATX 6E8]
MPGAFHGEVPGPVWPAEDSHSPWTDCRGPRQSSYAILAWAWFFSKLLKTTAKPRRRSSGGSIPPAFAGCTSATASRACGYGSNFRLTELQSAIGRIQLQRLPIWTVARSRNALLLAQALADGWSRDRILSEIAALCYPALSGSCSKIYLEKCFQEACLAPAEGLPVARELGATSLMFLVHLTIAPKQMAGYSEAVRSVVARACR